MAKAFHLHSLSEVSGSGAGVGLVIRAPESTIPALATMLERHGSRASFALRDAPSPTTVQVLDATNNEPFPELGSPKFVGWLHTRRTLHQEAAVLGVQGRLYYLEPSGGLTLGQYLLAHRVGAVPVRGRFVVRDDAALTTRPVQGGQILVVTLKQDAVANERLLAEVLAQLDQNGLTVESVGDLLGREGRDGGNPLSAGV